MYDIKEIINPQERNVSQIISDLKDRSVKVEHPWSEMIKDYEPTLHKINTDTTSLKDKHRSDGTLEKSARIAIGLEKLHCKRLAEFTFAIPVKRIYSEAQNDIQTAIIKAIEAVYRTARINSVNIDRANMFYACCQIFTIWYVVKKQNNIYGFDSQYKLKCRTYSPMNGFDLYALIDGMGDMKAMSFEYVVTENNREVTYFEVFTSEKHFLWKRNGEGYEEVTSQISDDGRIINGEDIVIGKIPGVYLQRAVPVYYGLSNLREEIEYTLSRGSNVVAYNSSPILKISGGIKGSEDKGEARRIYRVENGGDVAYVSWQQAIDAQKYHVDMMNKLYWMLAQIPDISFENLKGLGNIGYDARKTLFTDAHLKINDESGPWIEFFDREFNVIKSFLAVMNPKWEKDLDQVTCKHVITPFIQNDESVDIQNRMKANGGKAIESQLESITRFGKTDDPQSTLDQIQKEDAKNAALQASVFAASNQEE